jgi:hypothetical protein
MIALPTQKVSFSSLQSRNRYDFYFSAGTREYLNIEKTSGLGTYCGRYQEELWINPALLSDPFELVNSISDYVLRGTIKFEI